jgi:hypothetical protein
MKTSAAFFVIMAAACNGPGGDATVDGGNGSNGDAGASDGSPSDGSTGASHTMFIAIGKVGRTTLSCDGGKTWVANHSLDDTVRCGGGGGVDCDHNETSGHGLAYVAPWFVANFGHVGGSIQRTKDGVSWATVSSGQAYAAMLSSGTKLLAAAPTPLLSSDLGATWTAGTKPVFMVGGKKVTATYRDGVYDGTNFVVSADAAAGPVIAYSPDTVTWTQGTVPAACDRSSMVTGGGVILKLGQAGVVCRTADHGATWTTTTISDGALTPAWTGTEFIAIGNTKIFRSPNGAAWTSAPLVLRKNGNTVAGAPDIGVIGVGPNELVASSTPLAAYDKQKFYRSVDGTTWDELPTTAYVGSHPITVIRWGTGLATACP